MCNFYLRTRFSHKNPKVVLGGISSRSGYIFTTEKQTHQSVTRRDKVASKQASDKSTLLRVCTMREGEGKGANKRSRMIDDGHHHQRWGADKRMENERLQIACHTASVCSQSVNGLLFMRVQLVNNKRRDRVTEHLHHLAQWLRQSLLLPMVALTVPNLLLYTLGKWWTPLKDAHLSEHLFVGQHRQHQLHPPTDKQSFFILFFHFYSLSCQTVFFVDSRWLPGTPATASTTVFLWSSADAPRRPFTSKFVVHVNMWIYANLVDEQHKSKHKCLGIFYCA